MISRNIQITAYVTTNSELVIHFVQKANEFNSNIYIDYGENKLNAKSLMGVMCMGLLPGTYIRLTASGEDSTMALDALEHLLTVGI